MASPISGNKLYLGIGMALIAYLFFALGSSLIWYFNPQVATIQILFIQNIVSLFCVLPFVLRRGLNSLKTTQLHLHLIRDVFGLSSYFFFFLTIRYLNLVDATVLNYTSPFFVPLIWWIWVQEKVNSHVWWFIIIGFFGVATILDPSQEIFKLGFVFGLLAGISSAGAMCAVRVLNLHQEPLHRILFYFFWVSSFITFPFAWMFWVPLSGLEWVLAFSIGVATAMNQLFVTTAYRYANAASLSPVGYSVVIYNCLISYFIYGKELTPRTLLGTALIVTGGMLSYIWNTQIHSSK